MRYPVTSAIVGSSGVLTFAWWASQSLAPLGMSHEPIAHQPWTLITSSLLHINIVHLLFHCWLLLLGRYMEDSLAK